LRELSIKEDVRGETLNLTDFARLSDVLGRLPEGALEK
jgi:hypothetical protein